MKALKVKIPGFETTERLLGDLLGKTIKAFIVNGGLIVFPSNPDEEKIANELLAKYGFESIPIEKPPDSISSGWYLGYWTGDKGSFHNLINLNVPCDINLRVEALLAALAIWELNPDEDKTRIDPELIWKEDFVDLKILK